jgi:RNA polymerase sigma-70 factor (ECF subfamily)
MGTTAPSDEALLASRDPAGFELFYSRHVEDLLGFFARRTRDPELAADLTAETFAAALANRQRYRPAAGAATAWLFGIAMHKRSGARASSCSAARSGSTRRAGARSSCAADARFS